MPWRPDLSTVAFRVRPRRAGQAALAEVNRATRQLLDRVNATQRVLLSGTQIEGRQVIRVCVVVHRTHRDRIDEALDLITAEAGRL